MGIESKLEKIRRNLAKIEGTLDAIGKEATQTAPELPDLTGAYAVIWDYKDKSSTKLRRAGLSKGFKNPRPATSLEEEGSSPFDEIMPWSGMKVCEVGEGRDTMVYIPEFWYFSRKDKVRKQWIWAISPEKQEGFEKHPGSGRYVGRYHTSENDGRHYSEGGVKPLTNTNWNGFKKGAEKKGEGFGMMDIETWSAIQLLYLVEFADFNSQASLGTGYKSSEWEPGIMGSTVLAEYHTLKRDGKSNSYRMIEDPFSNVFDWIDGFIGCMEECWVGEEKLEFGLPDDGWIKNFGYSENAPWAFIPSRSSEDAGAIPEYVWTSSSSLYPASVGGYCDDSACYGLFYFGALNDSSSTYAYLGSRLQKT